MGWIHLADGWHVYVHPLYTPTVPDKSKTKEGVFSFRVDSEAKQHIAMYCGETEVGKRENGSVQRIFLIHLREMLVPSSAHFFFTGHGVSLQRCFCAPFLPTLRFMSWPTLNGIIYSKWCLINWWDDKLCGMIQIMMSTKKKNIQLQLLSTHSLLHHWS